MLVEVYGDTAPTNKSCREWFRLFKDGDFSVENKPRSGQPKKFEDKELEALLEEDQSQTQEEFAKSLGVTKLQLIRLSRALREKRPEYEQRHDKVIFLHDNARPHVAKIVKKYLETLKWLQIASKDESFFRDRIRKLPERWEKVAMDNTLINLFIHFVLK
ncbi:MOS1T transposase, partial [Pseudoatta argentina]